MSHACIYVALGRYCATICGLSVLRLHKRTLLRARYSYRLAYAARMSKCRDNASHSFVAWVPRVLLVWSAKQQSSDEDSEEGSGCSWSSFCCSWRHRAEV